MAVSANMTKKESDTNGSLFAQTDQIAKTISTNFTHRRFH